MSQMNDHDIVILEGARTPFGRFLGGLKQHTATQLATIAAAGALHKSKVNPAHLNSIVIGNVLQTSNDAAYLPRHVGIDIGAPISADALTVSRACGSALESIIQAARAIRLEESQLVLAGGTENMSMTPYVMRGVREGWKMMDRQVEDYLFQSLHDAKAGCQIGETVEALAEEHEITRAQADAAAVEGQRRAFAAQAAGYYAEEIVPVETHHPRGNRSVDTDESLRPDTTDATLAPLPGLYKEHGVVTAGNSTGLTDGAAMVVISSGRYARQYPHRPLGRIIGWGVAGVPPLSMGIGPVPASQKALSMAGLSASQMDVIELNDAFAVQYLAVQQALALDPAKVNPNGGAIALGHPMGATGTRLVLSALYHLRRTNGQYALCTLCIGGGQGIAVVVESLH